MNAAKIRNIKKLESTKAASEGITLTRPQLRPKSVNKNRASISVGHWHVIESVHAEPEIDATCSDIWPIK